MEDCSICFNPCNLDNFFQLQCCMNKMCKICLDSLLVPLCPYCRNLIPSIKDDPKYRLSISYDTSHLTQSTIQNLIETTPVISSNSTLLSESRILRRQIRRQRKLESRELDKIRNKELSRSRRMKELKNQINEEQDLFFFED